MQQWIKGFSWCIKWWVAATKYFIPNSYNLKCEESMQQWIKGCSWCIKWWLLRVNLTFLIIAEAISFFLIIWVIFLLPLFGEGSTMPCKKWSLTGGMYNTKKKYDDGQGICPWCHGGVIRRHVYTIFLQRAERGRAQRLITGEAG